MKNNICIIISLLSLLFFSCEEKEIELFSDGNEVYFEKFYMDALYPGTEKADSIVTSYFFFPEGTETIEVPVIVMLSGRKLEKDQNFSLKVINEKDINKEIGELYTTALPEEYTIDEQYTFHANNFGKEAKDIRDTLKIKLHRSDRLSNTTDGYRLVVELVPSDFLGLGQYERRRAIIHFSEDPAKPEWWDYEVEAYLLGEYSIKKYKLFLAHADPNATVNSEMIKNEPDKVIKLVMKFKDWLLKQNPQVKEDNGDLMTVKI